MLQETLRKIQEHGKCPYCNEYELVDITTFKDTYYIYLCTGCNNKGIGTARIVGIAEAHKPKR